MLSSFTSKQLAQKQYYEKLHYKNVPPYRDCTGLETEGMGMYRILPKYGWVSILRTDPGKHLGKRAFMRAPVLELRCARTIMSV